jgi:hypothetical protein
LLNSGGFAQRYDFGVCGGIAVAEGAVIATRQNCAVFYKQRTNWNLVGFGSGARFVQRHFHEIKVGHGELFPLRAE